MDPWEKLIEPTLYGEPTDTGVPLDVLKDIGDKLFDINQAGKDFKPHA